jgi:hypothetical protein
MRYHYTDLNITLGIWDDTQNVNISAYCATKALEDNRMTPCRQQPLVTLFDFTSMIAFQGLRVTPKPLITNISGFRMENGTWSNALGMLQRAEVDIQCICMCHIEIIALSGRHNTRIFLCYNGEIH